MSSDRTVSLQTRGKDIRHEQRSKILSMATWKDVDPDDVQIVEDAGESAKSLQRPGLNLLASVSQWDQSISPQSAVGP